MKHFPILLSLALVGIGCGDSKGKGASSGGSGGENATSLPTLTSTRTGIFLESDLEIVIELSTNPCEPDCPAGATSNAVLGSIYVNPRDQLFDSIPITKLEVRADGVDVPMLFMDSSYYQSNVPDIQPMAGKYEFNIETTGGSMIGLIYDTKYLVPHSIVAPAANTMLKVGQDVEVAWTPNDELLYFQVDFSNQPYDAVYAPGDPGKVLMPGSALTSVQDSEQIRVGRRVIQSIDGLAYSGIRHTHSIGIPVSVAGP
jgi:hypothetical protein